MAPVADASGLSEPSRPSGEHGPETGNEIRTSGGIPARKLWAGVARADITSHGVGPVNDLLYVKALVVTDGATTVVIVTVDAVALAEIGSLRNDYLANVRARLRDELNIEPACRKYHAKLAEDVLPSTLRQREEDLAQQAWRKAKQARGDFVTAWEAAGRDYFHFVEQLTGKRPRDYRKG